MSKHVSICNCHSIGDDLCSDYIVETHDDKCVWCGYYAKAIVREEAIKIYKHKPIHDRDYLLSKLSKDLPLHAMRYIVKYTQSQLEYLVSLPKYSRLVHIFKGRHSKSINMSDTMRHSLRELDYKKQDVLRAFKCDSESSLKRYMGSYGLGSKTFKKLK